MSDIARNAIIKLAIQLQTPNLKTPAIDTAVKAPEDLAQATKQATAANEAATKAAETAAEVAEKTVAVKRVESTTALDEEIAQASVNRERAYIRMEAAQARVGSSALTVAKGFLFMAAGQSESLNKLLPFMFA